MYIYGIHAVKARIREHPQSVQQIFVQDFGNKKIVEIINLASAQKILITNINKEKFSQIVSNNQNHQGIICKCKISENNYLSLTDFLQNHQEGNLQILALDQVHDPHNLGAIMRSADAFGCSAIIIPKDRAVGLTEAVSKSACGAAESVPLITVTNFARTLNEIADAYFEVVGLAGEGSEDFWEYSKKRLGKRVCWVLGGEEKGLRRLTREQCQILLSIPMCGIVESLNVSVTAALCLAEYCRNNTQTGLHNLNGN